MCLDIRVWKISDLIWYVDRVMIGSIEKGCHFMKKKKKSNIRTWIKITPRLSQIILCTQCESNKSHLLYLGQISKSLRMKRLRRKRWSYINGKRMCGWNNFTNNTCSSSSTLVWHDPPLPAVLAFSTWIFLVFLLFDFEITVHIWS